MASYIHSTPDLPDNMGKVGAIMLLKNSDVQRNEEVQKIA